ncbi:MAG TPA: phosphatidate cytidylyltransferase [Flavisolibacter sp.]|nr:phosphatidate cytidylyltransferase [Flavisolibacter sp.]
MAFNWKTFRTRTLTAIIFVFVMAVGLLWSKWSFFILFSIVHFGCWIEYQKLVGIFNPDYKTINAFHRYGVMLAGWFLMLFFTHAELQLGGIRLNEVAWWLGILFLFLFPLVQLITARNFFIKNIGYSFCGLLYISLSLALLIDMRNRWSAESYNTLGLTVPLLIIFTIWINDTMAYIVGSMIGKTPLSPISPKKTWEGTIGGALLAVLVMSLLAYSTGRLPVVHTAVVAALAAIAGTFGDLFESKLKRMAGVKDSGNIMPGHGGFLDRFDSLLFAATAAWFYAVVFI